MTHPEPQHPGPALYLARVHNLWLLRYHLPISEGVADCYQALLFLWLQQGYPAAVQASLPDLIEVTGASKSILTTRLAALEELGLLEPKIPGVKGSPAQYPLGPDPAQLLAKKFPGAACRWPAIVPENRYQNLVPIADTYQNLVPIAVNGEYQNLVPNPNASQNLVPKAGAKVIQLAKHQASKNGVENLGQKAQVVGVSKGTENFNSLNQNPDATPTPKAPAPGKLSPAQEYEQRKATSAAGAVAFEKYLAAYDGKNTETVAAWKIWQRLPPQDWQAILAVLPEYCLHTSGQRLGFRRGNAKFLQQETWKNPDYLEGIKQQYLKSLEPKTNGSHTNGNRQQNARISGQQRSHAPDVSDFGSLKD